MKKLLFVLLLSISSLVHAEWTLIETSDTATFFIDKSSIQQVNQYKRIWSKTEYFPNSKMVIENKISSTRMYSEYDCREKKSRFLSFQAYKQSNLVDLFFSDNKTEEWNFIAPNTYSMLILETVCKSK
jgi:hypothetical protein